MTKNCPNCGKQLPDDARFCMDCGYGFDSESAGGISDRFPVSNLFIVLIIAVLLVGGVLILTSGFGNNNSVSSDVADSAEHSVDMTVVDVSGWDSEDSESSKTSYTLYTKAIFDSVPNDLNGYNVKTTYYDSDDAEIGHETEKLSEIYYDSDYAISFGYYTTYKLPNPDHVTVEIVKQGKVVDTYTEKIDKNKIDYLN